MIIITDNPHHPSILSHRSPGYMMTIDDSIHYFDEFLYFDDGADWSDIDPPFYYLWNKKNNERFPIPVHSVKVIYFTQDRISEASI